MNTVGTTPLEMLEIRIASNLLALEERVKAVLQKKDVRDTLHAVFGVLIMFALLTVARYAFGTDGAEFAQADTTMEGWAKGHPGKTVVLGGLLWGTAQAIFKKDYAAFVMPSGIGILAGVIVGIIDNSYTATI
ncbi:MULTISPECIES: hypothetical protein [Burkholderia]|uniref:hypothetical protein n=1 Tax=Burkholderia TaxID=32008 RepID=UPI000D00870B|nr:MULTISPECIES: hypothetical protein [Burkholderia]MBU9172306.1 hypothetical protein [Burkholderia gladioli]MBU9177401.1 hypothetical protein [Burkholderia gladioli]MBU9324033.1 hypothetical protein [Burkholderia gladioli]MCA8171472.1 hypothetical protein [Burkholderia gladioli]PRG88494.1 hypothetical protein C6V08_34665 [Burkholderia gladioli]